MLLRSLADLYGVLFPAALITRLRAVRYSGWRLLYWFWHARQLQPERHLSEVERSWSALLTLGMLAQVTLGIGLLVQWARFGTAGAWEFGAALLLSYPLVWTHMLVVLLWA